MALNGADAGSGLRPRGGSFWMVGDRATIRLTGEETEGRLAIVELLVAPGGGPPPRVRLREDETFIVMKGEVALYLGENRVLTRAGDLVHVPKGSPHRFRNESGASARLPVLIAPAGLEAFFAEAGVPCAADDLNPPPVDEARIACLVAAAEARHLRFLRGLSGCGRGRPRRSGPMLASRRRQATQLA